MPWFWHWCHRVFFHSVVLTFFQIVCLPTLPRLSGQHFLSSGFYWSWWLLDQLANSYLSVHVGTKAHTSAWLFIGLFIETVSGLGFQSSCLSSPSVWPSCQAWYIQFYRNSAEFLLCPVKLEGKGGLLEGTHWDRGLTQWAVKLVLLSPHPILV